MKKLAAFLLAILLLTLCGCGMEMIEPAEPTEPTMAVIPTTPDGNLIAPTRPAASTVDHSAYAMTVRIIINPEIKLQLSNEYVILAVSPSNTDAETLLADLDLVGQAYDFAVTTILEAAKDANFLKDGVGVAITVKEVADEGNLVPSAMLTEPFEAYREQSGITFTYQVSSQNVADFEQATRTDTYTDPYGWKHTMYIQGEKTILDTYTRDDGTVVEIYPLREGNYFISIEYYPDGSYNYCRQEDLSNSGYLVYPDGSREYYSESCIDSNGTMWQWHKNRDGSTRDAYLYHEDGRLVRASIVYSDGTQEEVTFHPNGNMAVSVTQSSEGRSTDYFDENGVQMRSFVENSDGTTRDAIFYYEGGRLVRSSIIYSDGTQQEDTLHPNGNIAMSISQSNEGVSTSYFDENGVITSAIMKAPDGTTTVITYENGVCTGSTVTYPDGTTETQAIE